jgi:hypothetical protein
MVNSDIEWDLISFTSDSDWGCARSFTTAIGADEAGLENVQELEELGNWGVSDGETSFSDDEDPDGEEEAEVVEEQKEEEEEEQEEAQDKEEEKPEQAAGLHLELTDANFGSNDEAMMEAFARARTGEDISSITAPIMQSPETTNLHAKDTSSSRIDFWEPFSSSKDTGLHQRIAQSMQVDRSIRFIEQSVIPVLNLLHPHAIHKQHRLVLAMLLDDLVSTFMPKNLVTGTANSDTLTMLLNVIREEIAAARIRVCQETKREREGVHSSPWDYPVPSLGIEPTPAGRGDWKHSRKTDMSMPQFVDAWPRDHQFFRAPSDIRRRPLERTGPCIESAAQEMLQPTSANISQCQYPGSSPSRKCMVESGSVFCSCSAGEWEEVEEYLRQRYSAPMLEDPFQSGAKNQFCTEGWQQEPYFGDFSQV